MFSKKSQGRVGPSSAIAEDEGNLSNVWVWDEWLEAGSVPKKLIIWLDQNIKFNLKNWWKLEIEPFVCVQKKIKIIKFRLNQANQTKNHKHGDIKMMQ